ncbi:MAG: hypothetical protein M0D55_08985 [Elusimicrobiota bacterium]|nr:MAG: hypothetical protein M0D55_08985 [Elusimicrobiota bacterium]
MNAKERGEFLKAVRSCFPELDTKPLAAAAEACEAPGRWEVSVRGGGLERIGLRFFGEGDYGAWSKKAAEAFAAKAGAAPRPGSPWLVVDWDLKAGKAAAVKIGGASPKPGRFKPGFFGEPALDSALADFAALCPVSGFAHDGASWSLTLEKPPRWPLFARTDVSAAFTPLSSQLALLLIDRKVTELSFDGEALWAHCAG